MAAKKGIKFTKAHRLALSKAAKGKKFTKAHKLALSKAAKARYAKGKKREVNPDNYYSDLFKNTENIKIGDTLKIRLPNDYVVANEPKAYTPSPTLTLCGQLEDAILLLENRISNSIAKINSLM